MKIAPMGEVRNNFAKYLAAAEDEPVFVTKNGKIAAVIMEPVGAMPPENHFLHQVQELALREGAVFILDEIITGFRFAMGGAQELFGVIPDLATFGKAMSNGMPLSALVGRAEIMKEMEEVAISQGAQRKVNMTGADDATQKAIAQYLNTVYKDMAAANWPMTN